MKFGLRPSGRAHRGFKLAACRVILAASTALAWVWAAPAEASSTQTAAATASPVNLLQGDDATFARSAGTWANYSDAALQWSPSAGQGGAGGLVVTATGPKMAVLSGTTATGGLTPATPGSIYSAALSAESPSAQETFQPVLIFYTSTGAGNGAVFGPGTTVGGTNNWGTPPPVVAIAPPNSASVALAIIVYNTAAGDSVVLDNAWIEQTAEAATPAVVGPLSTSGTKIVQANGSPFTPRGVVLNGLETIPSATTVTQQAVVQAKVWGANIIRLPLGEQFWLSTNCDYSSGYQAQVDQLVNWITSLGMVALLDLHTNTVLGCEPGGPHNMADAAQSPTFWSQVAARYGSNPLVAFDLYNEPHDISDQVWLNGGTTVDSYAPFQMYQAAGMQQLYDAVRGAGAGNLVFATGTTWGDNPPGQLLNGRNVVYAAHAYTCPDSAPPACTSPNPHDPSPILDRWVTFSNSEPVAVTEFGFPSQSAGTYASNVITFARTRGWGWVAFAWEDAAYPAPFNLTEGWSPNSPAQPAPSGVPVLCELVVVSTGKSPCVAPPITPSPTQKSQMVPPGAGAGGSTPTGNPTAATSVRTLMIPAAPSPAPAPAAVVGLPSRTASQNCVAACTGRPAPAPGLLIHESAPGASGPAGQLSASLELKIALLLAALALFIVPPVIRRFNRALPARA